MNNAINTTAAEILRAKQAEIAAQQKEIAEQIAAMTAAAAETAKTEITAKTAEFKAAITAQFAARGLTESEMMSIIKAALFGAATTTATKRQRATAELKEKAQQAFDRGVSVAQIAARTGWACSVFFAGKEPANKIVVDGWETGKKGKVPAAAQTVIDAILDEIFGENSSLDDIPETTATTDTADTTGEPQETDTTLDDLELAPM